MNSWQWENFQELINSCGAIVDDHGPLAGPVHHFSIQRRADLSICMQTESPISATTLQPHHPPGTVRLNDDRVTFQTNVGLEFEAIGVHASLTKMHGKGIAPGVTTQEVEIDRVIGKLSHSRSPRYMIDWLENVPTSFLWPDDINGEGLDTITVTLGGVPAIRPKLTMKGQSSSKRSSWAAVALEVAGNQLYLRTLDANNITAEPGCIVYDGTPTDKFRDQVRRCLSFALGTYFVYLGVSRFDEEWDLTDFEAISPYSMRGQAMAHPPMPPSPLGPRAFLDIDATKLSRMVNAIYAKYDELNFGVVSWAYWHAATATPHIAAVHYGAALESLQRAYLKSMDGQSSSEIADKQKWDEIRDSLEASLDKLDLSSEIQETFKKKIDNLNFRSQHSTSEHVVKKLGLSFSEREKKAHKARHASAHGKDDIIDAEYIRNLKLLRMRFNRVLLAMTSGSDEYYDYFTLGSHIRRIQDPVP